MVQTFTREGSRAPPVGVSCVMCRRSSWVEVMKTITQRYTIVAGDSAHPALLKLLVSRERPGPEPCGDQGTSRTETSSPPTPACTDRKPAYNFQKGSARKHILKAYLHPTSTNQRIELQGEFCLQRWCTGTRQIANACNGDIGLVLIFKPSAILSANGGPAIAPGTFWQWLYQAGVSCPSIQQRFLWLQFVLLPPPAKHPDTLKQCHLNI
jgi:hypothetical protein